MRIGIVESDYRIHELLVDALNIYNHTPTDVDPTAQPDVDLIIIHPALDRSQDEQIREWHRQHIPVIILSSFGVWDYQLAEEITAPIFYMPFIVRDLMEAVWDSIIRARYAQLRGTAPSMYLHSAAGTI